MNGVRFAHSQIPLSYGEFPTEISSFLYALSSMVSIAVPAGLIATGGWLLSDSLAARKVGPELSNDQIRFGGPDRGPRRAENARDHATSVVVERQRGHGHDRRDEHDIVVVPRRRMCPLRR